jgi:hypothetical protein
MNSRPLTCMPCFCEKELFSTRRHFAHQRVNEFNGDVSTATVWLALWPLPSTAHQDVTRLTDRT